MNMETIKQRSILTIVLALVISFALFGCDKKTGDNASSETGEKNITATATPTPTAAADITEPIDNDKVLLDKIIFDNQQAMSTATHLMTVKYLGTETNAYGVKVYLFCPQRVLKGTLEGEENNIIHAIADDGESGSFFYSFNKDSEYLLCLEKHISVYEPQSTFIFYDNVFSSEDDQWSGILASAEQIAAETAGSVPPYYGHAFTVSTDISEIADFASNVFIVQAENLLFPSRYSTEVIICSVKKIWKNTNTPVNNGLIYIRVPEGTVTLGKSYVVFLADAEETSAIYTVAAKTNCVFSLEEAAGIPTLTHILAEATPYNPQ